MPCTEVVTSPRRGAGRALWLLAAVFTLPATGAAAGIGYASVSSARSALLDRAGARVEAVRGWTVVDAGGPAHTRWSFAPRAHPAYPALVRRDVVSRDGVPTLVTWFLCEGRRASCETLYAGLQAGSADVP
ncbi:MAG: hypothetical protein H6977_10840 [Gammaproteobacteria bacterium]|nr:hypothetical protein [Gammaproteobacteria bacterium]MCP5200499.1 hypothetical protein [Gammaproteobacteria bacterium]